MDATSLGLQCRHHSLHVGFSLLASQLQIGEDSPESEWNLKASFLEDNHMIIICWIDCVDLGFVIDHNSCST